MRELAGSEIGESTGYASLLGFDIEQTLDLKRGLMAMQDLLLVVLMLDVLLPEQ
jgi:hypothetical protein